MRHLFILLAIITAFYTQAQSNRLDYYQHTKTVWANGRTDIQSGDKGQFIKRTTHNGNPRCYDATSGGLDHLNGLLYYIGKKGSTDVYQGKSYWGENTYYQFDDQNGYLNVKDSSGNVYVFRRTSAPGGRTRSSYLANGASANGWDAQAEWNKIHNPITDVGGSNSSETKSNEGTSTNTHNSSRTCGYCHGNGRVRAHIGVSGFGLSTEKKKCPTCGVWYYTSEDHWHDCPYCKKK